jgi:hypothetical protein
MMSLPLLWRRSLDATGGVGNLFRTLVTVNSHLELLSNNGVTVNFALDAGKFATVN